MSSYGVNFQTTAVILNDGMTPVFRTIFLTGITISSDHRCFSLLTDSLTARTGTTLSRIHRCGFYKRKPAHVNPLGFGVPFAKGVVLKTLIKKPKKPNSANRKCVLVRLSTGKDMIAHIPGEGHNLQEHSVVLVRPGRTKDVPGLKLKCVRGKYDLGHVIKPNT